VTIPLCLCHIICCRAKIYTKKREIVISIVQHKNDLGNTLNENIFDHPFIIGNDGLSLYYLCAKINEELDNFIRTGKQPEKDRGTNKEYSVFSNEEEKDMFSRLTAMGMTVTYHSQQVELLDRITITYMKVQNPHTELSVSLIPWFVIAGRPYPIFTYIYAIGHYRRSEKKSLEESAAAVRKLFGINSFHKSTVSRSLSAMEDFIDASHLDRPLTVEALKKPKHLSDSQAGVDHSFVESVIKQVSEILTVYPSLEALENELGEKIKRCPEPVKRVDKISHALSGIPDEQFNVIIHCEPSGSPSRNRRKRPPRVYKKELKRVQRSLRFVDYAKREDKRRTFITICRHLTLDAAIKYHRFLV
jgi:hypothetical protein